MKATFLHDEEGRILAISKPVDLKQAGSKFTRAGMVAGRGQRLLDLDLAEEHASKPLRELHEQFQIDVATSKLVRKREPSLK
jgi:hypothetical protein